MLVADGLDLRSRGSPLRLKLLTNTHEAVSWGWVSRGGMIMAVVQARVLAGDSPRWWDATALIRRAQALRVRP